MTTKNKEATLPRMFGVEIECLVQNAGVTDCECRDGCEHDPYSVVPDLPRGWKSKRDGSIHDARGTELVSPPLTRLSDIDPVLRRLHERHEAVVTHECGLHVHIDGRDLTNHGIMHLMDIWDGVAPAMRRVVQPSRTRNMYCTPWSANECQSIRRAINQNGQWVPNGRDLRYREVNLGAFALHGTIEFRLHHGTVDAKEIKGWIVLCVEVVEAAKRLQKARDWYATGIPLDGLAPPMPVPIRPWTAANWLTTLPYGVGLGPGFNERIASKERLRPWKDHVLAQEDRFATPLNGLNSVSFPNQSNVRFGSRTLRLEEFARARERWGMSYARVIVDSDGVPVLQVRDRGWVQHMTPCGCPICQDLISDVEEGLEADADAGTTPATAESGLHIEYDGDGHFRILEHGMPELRFTLAWFEEYFGPGGNVMIAVNESGRPTLTTRCHGCEAFHATARHFIPCTCEDCRDAARQITEVLRA